MQKIYNISFSEKLSMKSIVKKILYFLAWAVLVPQFVLAQQPTFRHFQFDDNAIINNMSDNGNWAAAHGANASNTLLATGPRRLNLSTGEVKELTAGMNAASIASAAAYDVTNDGKIVVGELNGLPAYWSEKDGKWHTLEVAKGWNGGYAANVTPDGKWAVGLLTKATDVFSECAAFWNLETGKLIETEGLPKTDMAHIDQGQNRFTHISADGRFILGCMSVSYLPTSESLGGRFNYVYNVSEKTYQVIGFTETQSGRWQAHAEGLMFLSTANLSNNGNYVSGAAYLAKPVAGSQFPDEYEVPYIYDIEKNSFNALDTNEDKGIGGWTVGNNGTLLGATPINNPFREWSVRHGKYWYDIRHVLRENYGFDLLKKIGITNSGTPLSISNDGQSIAVLVDPYSSYVLQLPETIDNLCEGINLLSNYTVTPQEGSAISKLLKAKVSFDRDIDILGANNCAEIRDQQGKTVYRSVAFRTGDNNRTLEITFRRGDLDNAQNYTLFIPAGSISVAKDATKTNNDISIQYVGRAATPVKPMTVYPEENTAIPSLDMTTNPILLTFDTQVSAPVEVYAQLYRGEEEKPVCELYISYGGNQVAIYPIATTYLYKGSDYQVVIPAGAITDITGNCGNEEITLHYSGSYERKVSLDDKTLFKEDFNNGFMGFMLFEGDGLTPNNLMKAWGFNDGQNYPWILVRDNESSTDMAAAAHSMYDEEGKANDWMVTEQIYIPDNRCVLKFQSQSYLEMAEDYLKVMIWENESNYSSLSQETIEKIEKEGKVIWQGRLSPGASEEGLDNEWTHHTLDLAEFEGKSIYIAFVNENEGQSAIFVDNVEVTRNTPFLVSFDHATMVTNLAETPIFGRIVIDAETEVYNSIELTLKDNDGQTIGHLQESGLHLKKGDTYSFRFAEQLPLQKGKENPFSVVISLDNEKVTANASIKNLAFEPVKRVVLEEFSGMTCQNCPLGILAVEKIKSIYGDRFIPLVLHTYQGDQLGTGLESYSNYFKFTGAPQGMIQRNGMLSAPMMSVSQDYRFNGTNGEKLWLDIVNEEMKTAAEADIEATAAFTDESQKNITVSCNVRYALDAQEKNVNLFMVVLEDEVAGYQYNNLYTMTDPDLGEWGEGGIYAKSTIYPYYHQHVVRGWYGRSVIGTSGYVPSSVKAGENYPAQLTAEIPATVSDPSKLSVVVMMIDANHGKVINAAATPVKGTTDGIHSMNMGISVKAMHEKIIINSHPTAEVQVYSLDGRLLGTATGKGEFHISTNGYRGIAIVKVKTEGAISLVEKINVF